MSQKSVISVVIPLRREEETILKTLEAFRNRVRTPYEIIAVDDCVDPDDHTARIVRNYARTHVNIRLVLSDPGIVHGFGAALERGVRAAKTNTVVIMPYSPHMHLPA